MWAEGGVGQARVRERGGRVIASPAPGTSRIEPEIMMTIWHWRACLYIHSEPPLGRMETDDVALGYEGWSL